MEFSVLLTAVLAEPRQVSRVFHPEPPVEFQPLANGSNAHVVVGKPGYQLSSGEIINVDNP